MAQIQIPETSEPLLPFCQPWSESLDNACFKTYADLIVFAAGYGFHLHGRTPPSRCAKFLSAPNPIDMSVFKTQQLLPLILLLGLSVSDNYQIAREEEKLARLVEDYANFGCSALVKKLKASTPQSFHLDLASLLRDAATSDQI